MQLWNCICKNGDFKVFLTQIIELIKMNRYHQHQKDGAVILHERTKLRCFVQYLNSFADMKLSVGHFAICQFCSVITNAQVISQNKSNTINIGIYTNTSFVNLPVRVVKENQLFFFPCRWRNDILITDMEIF